MAKEMTKWQNLGKYRKKYVHTSIIRTGNELLEKRNVNINNQKNNNP